MKVYRVLDPKQQLNAIKASLSAVNLFAILAVPNLTFLARGRGNTAFHTIHRSLFLSALKI